ncbi:Alpha/Beta hydrolase fold containing protein [Trema orientale]|uniref:Alpha/Beta hydrolase fold containing protein n=1 Tax=Trema orientale TaxID=63057 RepID=A0A2P5E176_TREOI|nr:Alpha/Beta hydrolase fold containing protein [Trema orientale]
MFSSTPLLDGTLSSATLNFLNMFFPEKATALAIDILNELVAELKIKPCPVVFAYFSGGPKACMFKVLQSMKAPYFILCSENDDLAPYQTICNFAQRLQELGGDVKGGKVEWLTSRHYRHYRIDYEAAVTELLGKATAIYSQRIRRLEGRDVGSMQDERRQEGLIHLPNPPTSINAHGVLGQILFDVCIPKNVEGWDIRSSDSLNRCSFTSTWRRNPFNPIKCIRHSRL